MPIEIEHWHSTHQEHGFRHVEDFFIVFGQAAEVLEPGKVRSTIQRLGKTRAPVLSCTVTAVMPAAITLPGESRARCRFRPFSFLFAS